VSRAEVLVHDMSRVHGPLRNEVSGVPKASTCSRDPNPTSRAATRMKNRSCDCRKEDSCPVVPGRRLALGH
jgi:hypothetical protein